MALNVKSLSETQIRAAIFVSLMLLVAVCLIVVMNLVHTSDNVRRTFSEPIERVELDVGSGDIDIVAWAGNSVEVERSSTYVLRDPSVTEQVDGTTLRITQRCDGVNIGTCETDFTVLVPAAVPVSVTTDGGDVKARALRSDSRFVSDSGDVELNEMFGAIDVETSSGAIAGNDISSLRTRIKSESGDVSLTASTAPENIDVETVSGNITLLLPENAGPYRVDAGSNSGTVTTDIASADSSARIIRAQSESGDVEVSATGS